MTKIKKLSKVSDIQNVDVLDSAPPQLFTSNVVSPVATSSIRPEFLTFQGKNDTSKNIDETKSVKSKHKISELVPGSSVSTNETIRVSRDPRGINDHVKVEFEDVIGEADDVQSVTHCWRCSRCCYTSWKNCVYKLVTLFTAFPTSVFYGCWFGLNVFTIIWILKPFSHAFHMCCGHCFGVIVRQCVSCVIGIPCQAAGQIFWIFNTKAKKLTTGPGRRGPRVTFSDKVRTKRIPRKQGDQRTESQKRLLFSRSPWQRRLF